jgi:REP element-mobilizing transposase RayT
VREALCIAKERLGMRIIHFSVQEDHVHLIVEVEDSIALGRAMKGFQVRVARRLNRALGRSGRVFADRYHARYLKTPTEARRALVYVLQNGKKHAPTGERNTRDERSWVDPFSSAAYFHGWKQECRRFIPSCDAPGHPLHRERPAAPVVAPRVWLLREGWRRAGGDLDTHERPEERPNGRSQPPADMKRRTSSRPRTKPPRPVENGGHRLGAGPRC